jgi:erythromycin esterase
VRIFAPDEKLLAEIDSPNGVEGDEPIALEAKNAGTYRLEVLPNEDGGDTASGRYEIRINEILSTDTYAQRLAEQKRTQASVVAWLRENAVPLKTVEAGNGFDDLQPLKRVLRDVRFVGLGEATHGTREFFQFKHRVVEFLVREMGFRVFAIEASYSACQNINDYVMSKTDDGAKALDSQGFWTWNTEEVRSMLDWMRAYNQSVSAEKRVKFAGFDIQINNPGKAKLLEYLKRVAPERSAATDAFFQVDEGPLINVAFGRQSDKAKEARAKLVELRAQYNGLFIFLELHGAELATKTSQTEYEEMREYARVLVQSMDSYSEGSYSLRDLYMADNVRRLAEREPFNTRVVLWAHNGHIMTDNSDPKNMPLGAHLRRFFGKEYYALGFSFNQGTFQAREAQPKDPANRMLMSFTAHPAPDDSIDGYLAQTGVKSFIIDFRSARNDAVGAGWLASAHPMRSVGAIYAPSGENSTFSATTLSRDFDGLFFIETATRARPNPSVKNAVRD